MRREARHHPDELGFDYFNNCDYNDAIIRGLTIYITILAQKGGAPKTTTAVNLSAAFSKTSSGILADVDLQQCDATRFAGSIPGVKWVSAVPDAAPKGGFVIVDTPPLIVPETGLALSRSDLVVVPCMPVGASLESMQRTFQTINLARASNPKLFALVLFTCVDRSPYTKGVIAAARVLSEWAVMETEIPLRKMDFENAYAMKRPVLLNAPKSAATAGYWGAATEIRAALGGMNGTE